MKIACGGFQQNSNAICFMAKTVHLCGALEKGKSRNVQIRIMGIFRSCKISPSSIMFSVLSGLLLSPNARTSWTT